jgi:hypothetical protein
MLWLLISLLIASSVVYEKDGDVLVLTDDNLESAIKV